MLFRLLASLPPSPNDSYLMDLMMLVDGLLRLEQEDGAVAEIEVDEVLRLCRVCGRGQPHLPDQGACTLC